MTMNKHLVLTALALTLVACAPAMEPLRLRASEMSKMPKEAKPGQPIIIELAEGDVIPIDLRFSGDLIELVPPKPALSFRAKKRFFVRIDKSGIKTSTDGVSFDQKAKEPGSFRLGLSAKPEGTKVEIDLKMPKRGGS
jgi:hypothetical protein